MSIKSKLTSEFCYIGRRPTGFVQRHVGLKFVPLMITSYSPSFLIVALCISIGNPP